MKYYHFYVLLLSLSAGCGLFSNTRASKEKAYLRQANKTDLEILEQKNLIKDSTGFIFYADSARHDYTIQFWPKGRFTFTAENGFSGEAHSILIKGSSREQVGYSRMVRLQEKDQGSVKEKLRVSNRAIHKQAHIVKTNSDWGKWVGGGLILIAIIGLLLYLLKKAL
ncbi:hypothetical protein [Pedobacter cryoconitis]|uniref:Lipoprotein n=1 Tax=Pedobacter cryoconitis TaxID=188932 RepID=A0A7X0MH37_9SPHI|nr:hypothetical protein [Pedobacter cryoconitis]MBB6498992.1 hypothetical protein [Pedobacter cryoconitis]